MSSRGYISREREQKCEMCKLMRECRPYGPNREQICVRCAEKDIEGTEQRMKKYLFGEET